MRDFYAFYTLLQYISQKAVGKISVRLRFLPLHGANIKVLTGNCGGIKTGFFLSLLLSGKLVWGGVPARWLQGGPAGPLSSQIYVLA